MSYSRRRKFPWHQRPRAWIRGWLYHVLGREEEQPLTDDHGNHIGDLIDDAEPHNPGVNGPWLRPWERVGLLHDRPEDDRPVIQAALVQGETIILDGKPSPPYNPAWMPCWSRQDVPRPGTGPGYQGEAPAVSISGGSRGGRATPCLRLGLNPGPSTSLSAFASPFGAPGRIPPTPRPPREPVTWWRPRECGGRITLLAGA